MEEQPRLFHAMSAVIRANLVSPAPQKAGTESLTAKAGPVLHAALYQFLVTATQWA
jgi:hypothetical protein